MTKVNKIELNTTKKILQDGQKNLPPELSDLVKKYSMQLRLRAEREVPEYGEFANVYEKFTNPDKSLCASDFVIRIVKPPKTIKNHETIRNLELVAYKYPSQYKASVIIATGTKTELLKKFNENDIYKKIEENLRSAANSLENF